MLLLVALACHTAAWEDGRFRVLPGDTGAPPVAWGEGDRAVSGQAFFFDMPVLGQLSWETDVEGAVAWVLEAPEMRVDLDPADGHAFRFEGIPAGVEVTLALDQDDYYPQLTATLPVGTADLEGVTFQAVSRLVAEAAAALLGADAGDDTRCQMATTVTAPGATDVWAAGEPGATVSIEPPVPPESGPYYFGTDVIPDTDLDATTTDGGVLVVGAEPGVYRWTGHKEGVTFDELKLTCLGGRLTNAAPPWGMNAAGEGLKARAGPPPGAGAAAAPLLLRARTGR